jgi:hypothetical protein
MRPLRPLITSWAWPFCRPLEAPAFFVNCYATTRAGLAMAPASGPETDPLRVGAPNPRVAARVSPWLGVSASRAASLPVPLMGAPSVVSRRSPSEAVAV